MLIADTAWAAHASALEACGDVVARIGGSGFTRLTAGAEAKDEMHNTYIETITLVERVHRRFLELVKLELDGLGIHDINNVQALLLFNLGDAVMTVSELGLRGCYLGSNVSYNLKKTVANGYLSHERSMHDRRTIHVRLTDKGAKLRDRLQVMHQRHTEMLNQSAIADKDLQSVAATMQRLDRFLDRVPGVDAVSRVRS